MNIEQIEQAEQNLKALKKVHRDNELIREFINRLQEATYLRMTAANQLDLDIPAKELCELIGSELIELLQEKLDNRQAYLDSLDADDLLKVAT